MKAITVRMRVLRPLMLGGKSFGEKRELDVSVSDAALLLESGRAELANAADFVLVRDAVRAEVAAILRSEKANSRTRV